MKLIQLSQQSQSIRYFGVGQLNLIKEDWCVQKTIKHKPLHSIMFVEPRTENLNRTH